MRIDSKAPTRIDLAGGTLDIWPLYLFHEGALTVNCAITRYASCRIETHRGPRITLVSRDTRRSETFASLTALARARRYRLPLLAHLVRYFQPRSGFTLTTDSEAPAGAGGPGAVAACSERPQAINEPATIAASRCPHFISENSTPVLIASPHDAVQLFTVQPLTHPFEWR